MDTVIIPLSKTKLLLAIGGSVLFILVGFFFLIPSALPKILYFLLQYLDIQNTATNIIVKSVGITSILFFGSTLIYGIRKSFDNTPGLIINDKGITDNSNASSIGFINWNDIIEIKTEKISSNKFILIYVFNPDFYINKAKGAKRKLMQGNNKIYGTPLSISPSSLKYKFTFLEHLLINSLNEYKKDTH